MAGMIYALFLLLFVLPCFGLQKVSLNGKWQVSSEERGISIPGDVPGSMYTALLDNQMIGDPYYRDNDRKYRWIGQEDWTYTRSFNVDANFLKKDSIMLVCEGLDTIANVTINNKTVGKSDNMFVRYTFDVKSALMAGKNVIMVSFTSAVQYARYRAQHYPYLVLPGFTVPTQHGENHVNMLRKMQCSFSWDWGPSFPTQGVWKDIYILGYTSATMTDVTAETRKNKDGSWDLIVGVFTDVTRGSTATGTMEVILDRTTVTQLKDVTLTSQFPKVAFNISIPKNVMIREWWPNGYGQQELYNVTVNFTDSAGKIDLKTIRIGFRTVELVQDYVSSDKNQGRTFYFRINGQPIFFKGSNWVPADSFPERVTRDRLYNYLRSAADVHMNAMRVWGGGVYESDMFYEICDELGIMLWQDFMFACSMYPTDPDFLSSVTQEVTHQIRRLKHHPSIVVLSGNNENEKALVQDWYGTSINYTRYKDDYLKLYRDVIYKTVQQEDTSRPFLMSSPTNGLKTEEEGWVAKEPWSSLYGDIHDYRYLAPFFDPGQYRIPRFASEYGLQSFPSMETLEPVYNTSDFYYWGPLNEYRNHHPFGNIEMMAEAIQYVKLPNSPDLKQEFEDLIYVTQITHAVGMATETEHYRRWQNRLDEHGQGNTMGALYWMLADIWQAPTWASIEYGGKWKMLHYFAQHFFAPTLISPFMNGSYVDVYIVMDELPVEEVRHSISYNLHFQPKSNPRPFNVFDLSTYESSGGQAAFHTTNLVEEATPPPQDDFRGNLYIEMYAGDNFNALHTWKIPFKVTTTAQSVFRENVKVMATTAGCLMIKKCFLVFHFGDPDNGPTSWIPLTNEFLTTGLKNSTIQVTDVNSTSQPGVFDVHLSTDAIAAFVWLEARGIQGRFSDNGFLLYKQTIQLKFYAWQTIDSNSLMTSLRVKSLMNIYH